VIEDAMPGFFDTARDLAKRLYSAPSVRPTVDRIPSDQCIPNDEADREIVPNQAYFSVVLNELHLAIGRQLWATYDPMVLATVEHVYNGKPSAIPVVVGPGMIKKSFDQQAPQSLVINDIPLAGPHPYRGGNVTITLLLYRIKRTDYAKGFLKFAENVSKAAGVPANIDTLQKVGSALIDGLDDLLGMKDNEPIAGHVFTIDGGTRRGFRTAYSVLISDEKAQLSSLRVNGGRLEVRNGAGFSAYRDADYVLYSVVERSKRGEVETLPFWPMLDQSVQAALANDDESWKRAKAALLSLYGQMVASPDLIAVEVDSLIEEYTKKVIAARDRAKAIGAMSISEGREGEPHRLTDKMNSRIGLLDLT
jgi:hypothetical protein